MKKANCNSVETKCASGGCVVTTPNCRAAGSNGFTAGVLRKAPQVLCVSPKPTNTPAGDKPTMGTN